MKRFILAAVLTIGCFVSKAQINPNDSVSTSAAAVPSGQVLYLNFNNNFNDQSGFNNAVSNYNVTFSADHNNAANAAANFDGCAGNRAYLKVGNSANLQVSNAMTISFWAKVDLSMGMNPHDGACSPVGHHILFAKGGDGYGTSPNGFYSKLEPNGSNATNLFGSSPNSGNLAYTTTINSPNSWKFYTYVITGTQYQLYINGTLQNSGSHNINFNEINNEDLYIGVLGPKSTPALGIANWYPMRGQMDDFRVFNRALTNTEINGLYSPEETGGDAPAITQIQYLGESRYYSSTTEYILRTEVAEFQDDLVVYTNNAGRYGNYSANLSKFISGNFTSKRYSYNANISYQFSHISRNILKNGNQYYHFSATSFLSTPMKDSLLIYDTNLNIIKRIGLNSEYFGAFFRNNQLVVLSKAINNSALLYITIYDQNGNFQSQRSIEDTINDFAFNDDRLVMVNDYKFYTFLFDPQTFSVNFIGAQKVKIATNNIILTSQYSARVFNTLSNSLITINNYASQCFVADNKLDYYLVANGQLTKYNSNNNPVNTKVVPAFTEIKFKKDLFLFINKITIDNSDNYQIGLSLININVSLPIYQTVYTLNTSWMTDRYFYYGALDFTILPSQEIIIMQSKDIIKISSNGNLLWKKNLSARHLYANNDNSFWLINASSVVGLMHIQNDNNKCNYEVINPFSSNYHTREDGTMPQVQVNLKGNYPLAFMASIQQYYISTLDGLGINCKWYKNGQLTDSTFYGYFRGNGQYKVLIQQENCNVESITKNIVYSESVIPSPSIIVDKPNICVGDSAIISGSCTDGNQLRWLDNSLNTSRTVTPNVTTSYFANCQNNTREKRYGIFSISPRLYFYNETYITQTSPNTTATINVYDGNQISTLSGQAISGMEYKGGKIISTQTIPSNQRNTYQFIKSAELRGSFSAANGSVLTIEADETCNN